jgi:hypothetical protein
MASRQKKRRRRCALDEAIETKPDECDTPSIDTSPERQDAF